MRFVKVILKIFSQIIDNKSVKKVRVVSGKEMDKVNFLVTELRLRFGEYPQRI